MDGKSLYEEGVALYGQGKREEACVKFEAAAEQGYAPAQYMLGMRYHSGMGVDRDRAKAFFWWQRAAEQGHARAQATLGYCYLYGDGAEQDYKKAAYWYQKAAEQDFAPAQYQLGIFYENGAGVAQDLSQAICWYKRAAEQGNGDAQLKLSACYRHGVGVEQDLEEAEYWEDEADNNEACSAKKRAARKMSQKRDVGEDIIGMKKETDMEKNMYTFYAFMNRMKLIQRWNLMRSNIREDLMQHTASVAIFGQALGIIRNTLFGGDVNVDKIASLALYHDTAEVVSGDLPTPVKYYNDSMKGAYKDIENEINHRLIDSLPEELKEAYTPYIMPYESSTEYKLMKLADKLSAFVKCTEEKLLGNSEFDKAYNRLKGALDSQREEFPELGYFLDNFMDGFSETIDIL